MKKIVVIAAIALCGTILLPSCKKDYTCTCTYTNPATNTATSVPVPFDNYTKKDAKAACDAASASYSMYLNASCKLD